MVLFKVGSTSKWFVDMNRDLEFRCPPELGSLLRIHTLFVCCCCSPPDRKGLLDFMLESAFAMLLHQAPTQYPARAARQWIPPSITPVDPAEYPARAARQWIPPSIPPERLASGSRRVSPVDPAEYPARAARQWIPPSIPPERLASGSRRVSRQSGSPVDPASIPPEQLASGSRPVSRQASGSCRVSGLPAFASETRQYPARAACQSGFA